MVRTSDYYLVSSEYGDSQLAHTLPRCVCTALITAKRPLNDTNTSRRHFDQQLVVVVILISETGRLSSSPSTIHRHHNEIPSDRNQDPSLFRSEHVEETRSSLGHPPPRPRRLPGSGVCANELPLNHMLFYFDRH